MQIYADVTGREIEVAASSQTPALGSAMFGAVAAGQAAGGYDSIVDAAAQDGAPADEIVYRPDPAHRRSTTSYIAEYRRLHDYFGRGGNDVMKTLKRLRDEAIRRRPAVAVTSGA